MKVLSKYEVYLQSEEFNILRQNAKERDGHKCVVCGAVDDLQIHHLTYLHIYHEQLDELVTVCRKCHSIFHKLDNMRKYIEEKNDAEIKAMYEKEVQARNEEIRQKWEERTKEREQIQQKITEEIKDEYMPKDYAKDGCLDLCDWAVLNPIIDQKCKEHSFDGYLNKTEIRNWFFYRRMELFLRCLNKGLSIKRMIEGTKFSESYLRKWYNKDRVLMKLEEEKTLNNLKGGITI